MPIAIASVFSCAPVEYISPCHSVTDGWMIKAIR